MISVLKMRELEKPYRGQLDGLCAVSSLWLYMCMTELDIWLSLPNLFSFFNVVLPTLSCLHFQINFSIHLSITQNIQL